MTNDAHGSNSAARDGALADGEAGFMRRMARQALGRAAEVTPMVAPRFGRGADIPAAIPDEGDDQTVAPTRFVARPGSVVTSPAAAASEAGPRRPGGSTRGTIGDDGRDGGARAGAPQVAGQRPDAIGRTVDAVGGVHGADDASSGASTSPTSAVRLGDDTAGGVLSPGERRAAPRRRIAGAAPGPDEPAGAPRPRAAATSDGASVSNAEPGSVEPANAEPGGASGRWQAGDHDGRRGRDGHDVRDERDASGERRGTLGGLRSPVPRHENPGSIVNVTIGRIEIHTTTAAAPQSKPVPPRGPRLTIDGYLAKRNGVSPSGGRTLGGDPP